MSKENEEEVEEGINIFELQKEVEESKVKVKSQDLKNQALLERLSEITSNYENQAAEYRVGITLLSEELESTRKLLEAHQANAGKKTE